MSTQDKTLTCSDCGASFAFAAQEQELFKSLGYTNEPKRCPACRQARKSDRRPTGGSGFGGTRQMYPAKCAECGKDTEVPFEPRTGRPVYCSDCYRKIKPSR